VRRGRVDAADELAPIVGCRIGAIAAEVATGIGFGDRDANAAAEGLDDQEVVAVGPSRVAEIDLEPRAIRDCVYRLKIK
jgi:ubiquinone biosynthesis protein UbiJ